jgi:hypothetical protein
MPRLIMLTVSELPRYRMKNRDKAATTKKTTATTAIILETFSSIFLTILPFQRYETPTLILFEPAGFTSHARARFVSMKHTWMHNLKCSILDVLIKALQSKAIFTADCGKSPVSVNHFCVNTIATTVPFSSLTNSPMNFPLGLTYSLWASSIVFDI